MLYETYCYAKSYQDKTEEGYNSEKGFSLCYLLVGLLFNMIGFIITLFDIFQSCGSVREKMGGIIIAFLYWPFYWILKIKHNLCTI